MPVIKETCGWYTDAEIGSSVPLPQSVGGRTPNTPDYWNAVYKLGEYTGSGFQYYFADVAEHLPENGRWCDIGCGMGTFMSYMANRKPSLEAWGWDPIPTAIDHAKKHQELDAKRLAIGALPDRIPWPGVSFDVVTVLEVIEHFSISGAKEIIEAAVSIAPLTILTVPNGLDVASGHYVWYDLELFRSLLPAGYSVRSDLLKDDKHWMFVIEKETL